MQTKQIDSIANVYLFLDYKIKHKDELIKSILKDNPSNVGFNNKTHLKQHLNFMMFDYDQQPELPVYSFDQKKIMSLIKSTITKCHKTIPSKPTNMFVYPNYSSFIKQTMSGVHGDSRKENVFALGINPSAKHWKTGLKNVICHEYLHSVTLDYHQKNTLLDMIIYDGLAEHFRESVIGGKKAPWSNSVSKQECIKHFKSLKDKLDSKDDILYREVFFFGKQYPKWLGYSLGYHIVASFLNKNKLSKQ